MNSLIIVSELPKQTYHVTGTNLVWPPPILRHSNHGSRLRQPSSRHVSGFWVLALWVLAPAPAFMLLKQLSSATIIVVLL